MDIGIALFLQRFPVVAGDGDVEAVVRSVMRLVRVVRRVPHQLLRHAADVDAGSAERARLDHGRFRTILGRALRVGQAAAAAADDE